MIGRRIVECRRDGERRKTYLCSQSDTEFSRPLNTAPTPKRT